MRKYVKYWYVILLGAVLGLTGAYLYLRYVAVPKYSITSTILIRQEENAPTLAGLTNSGAEELMSKPMQNLDNETQILRSKSLMERVVNEMALYASYSAPGDEKKKPLYGKTLPVAIEPGSALNVTSYDEAITVYPKADSTFTLKEGATTVGSYKLGQPVSRPYGVFKLMATPYFAALTPSLNQGVEITFSNPQNVAEEYSQLLTVSSVNKEASILNLMLISTLPEQGRDVMNKLLEVYNQEAVEDKNLTSANKLGFLDNRIKYLSSELNGVERNVEQYKQSHEVANVAAQTSNYVEQADSYQRKIAEWASQIAVLESIERYLNQNPGQYRMVPSTLGIQDQTLLDLIAKFNNLQLERERMLRTTQEGNPLVQNLTEQLANLRTSILENLRNIKNGLVITSRGLQASSGQARAKLSDAPVVERELQAKGRQQTLKQNIYLYLLQKREEAALALASTTSNSRVVDSASIGDQPISPNHKMTYLLGLLLGMGLPLSVLYAKGQLNNKVESRKEVEELTATPILGEIAHKRGKTLVVTRENRSALAEMFGLVRANLSFAAAGRANKVTLVTSSVSGEGKTFFAINLSNSLVLTGKRVVLLDLDLRKPSLAKELALHAEPGITDYLVSERLAIDDILQTVPGAPDLFVISAGSVPPNPAELLTSPKLVFLLNELKESFDHIIIDTAPIGLVADAFSISPLADSTICIVRYNYTHRDQLKSIEGLYDSKKFNNLTLVLNDARTNVSNYYGYGYVQDDTKSKKQKIEA